MDDSISRKTVLEMIPKYVSDAIDERTLCYDIEHLPSAQRKWHWVENHDSDHSWKCSECGCGYTDSKLSFCYDCGADMRES